MPTKATTVTLPIRNMVCDRCIRVVREELERLGLDVRHVELGEALVAPGSGPVDLERIGAVLEQNGFELIRDRRKKVIEDVRQAVIRILRLPTPIPARFKLSQYISHALGEEYHAVSGLFSSVEGITLEHYFILQKIERVKELIKYGERPLKEIAWDLGYSSTQHLSNQFKQVTGMTPTQFRKIGTAARIPLDRVENQGLSG